MQTGELTQIRPPTGGMTKTGMSEQNGKGACEYSRNEKTLQGPCSRQRRGAGVEPAPLSASAESSRGGTDANHILCSSQCKKTRKPSDETEDSRPPPADCQRLPYDRLEHGGVTYRPRRSGNRETDRSGCRQGPVMESTVHPGGARIRVRSWDGRPVMLRGPPGSKTRERRFRSAPPFPGGSSARRRRRLRPAANKRELSKSMP